MGREVSGRVGRGMGPLLERVFLLDLKRLPKNLSLNLPLLFVAQWAAKWALVSRRVGREKWAATTQRVSSWTSG
jgi:hypothetical protein